MSKVIVINPITEFSGSRLIRVLDDVCTELAKVYKSTGSKADFAIVVSQGLLDMCITNERYYSESFERDLKEQGVYNVHVRGIMGGLGQPLHNELERIYGGEVEYLNNICAMGPFVLYQLQR